MSSPGHSAHAAESVSKSSSSNTSSMFDLVCIGFGPSQLATAIANEEAGKSHKVLYLEQKPSFSWTSTPHMSRTRMESPFIYDLATLRNPRSAYSYASYLLARSRLIEFANSDRLNPLREEFDDYLRWSAGHFKDQVRYGNQVLSVTPTNESDLVGSWKVAVKQENGQIYTIQARNVVAPSPSKADAPGTPPLFGINFLAGQRIMPMQDYVSRRNELRGAPEPRLNVSVVGSGQQTAEVLDDLLSCPRLGNITIVTDDQLFAPLAVLDERDPPQPALCSLWAKPANVSNTAVTEASELIQNIYMRGYEKQVQSHGEYRLRVCLGKDASSPCVGSDFIIRDTTIRAKPSNELLQGLDSLALGCQQRGESLSEVHFRRGAVATNSRVWLLSNATEAGSLAKDVSLMAGEIVKQLASSSGAVDARDVQVQARI